MPRASQPLKQLKPGYDKYDQALAAMQKKDLAGAKALAAEAVRLVPREGQFQQLLGDIALSEKAQSGSLAVLPESHGPESRLLRLLAGRRRGAIPAGQQAAGTAMAGAQHGTAAHGAGVAVPRQHGARQRRCGRRLEVLPERRFIPEQHRAGSDARSRADRPARNPSTYVVGAVQAGSDGKPVLVVQNRAPMALGSIAVTPVMLNAAGQVASQGRAVTITGPLAAGQQVAVDAGLGTLTAEQLRAVRVRIDSARVAQ